MEPSFLQNADRWLSAIVACTALLAAVQTSAAADPATQRSARVYLLDNGHLECDANWMVAMSVVGTKGDPHPPAQWINIPVYAVLIDHPDGKILFDTGCSPQSRCDDQAQFPYYHEDRQTLTKQLELAGTRPDEIQTVVLSHLHFDHAGNIDLFKHARFVLSRKEFDSVKPANLAEQNCRFVDSDQEIARGVKLITLPGHTAGLLGLMVELRRDGVQIFPSDAIYTRANFGPPAKSSGIVHDSLSFFASIEKVRKLAEQHHAKILFPHDMEFFHTLRRAPQWYE